MKGLIENRFGLLGLVLVALAALYGVAYVGRPAPAAQRTAQAVKAPVEAVTAVCPAPGGSRISVVTPPAEEKAADEPSAGAPGRAVLAAVRKSREDGERGRGGGKGDGGKSPRPVAVIERPGVLWQREMPSRSGPISVAATGAMAPGLESAQTARETSGAQRGLAGVRCVEPGAEAWFVGPGPAGADVRLYLANADPAPVDASIMIYSGEGPVLSERGSGVILGPGEHRVIDLRELAPSPLVMALRVSTGSGRVAAAVKAVLGERRGVDWLPAAAPPSTSVVVPGIPGTAGRRELYVTAPGDQDTVVQVKAVLKDGFYALKNKEEVDVPAGTTVTLDLTTGIGGQPAALVLTADVPIVAGMMIAGTGTAQDVAFTAGAPPIDLGSVVADGLASGKQTSRLVLSAPFAAGAVQVQLVPKKGAAPRPMAVSVPAGRTREIKLTPPRGSGSAFAVVVRPEPGSGPVYGGRVLDESTSDGLLITAQPLALARIWALVPPTVDSPAAVLPPS